MAWTRIVNNYWYGHYYIDIYYETKDNPKENYTEVTVSKFRVVHDDSAYYLYNYYPTSNPDYCADLGLSLNGDSIKEDFYCGALTGTRELAPSRPLTARINHNSNGSGSVSIGIYLDIAGGKAPPSYIGWVSTNITLTTFDRNSPSISARAVSNSKNSATFNIWSNYDIEKTEYQINNGSWQNADLSFGANQTKSVTIHGLSPNTKYGVNWRVTRSYNGLSNTTWTSIITDADPPTITNLTVTNRQKNYITIQISGHGGQNNPINGYSYSLDGRSWSGYTSSNTITIGSLKKNTTYHIYAKIKSSNGKESGILSTTVKTLADPPYIGGIQTLLRKTRKIRVQAINYGAQAGIKNLTYSITPSNSSVNSFTYVDFLNLTPKTSYTIKCVIRDNDDQIASTSVTIVTKADIPQNFLPTASNITNSSFKISLPKIEADLSEIIYHVNTNNYHSLEKEKTFNGLSNFAVYTVYIDVTNDEGIKARSQTIQVKTLPHIPQFDIQITGLKPREFTFEPILINKPGVNLAECYYSIDSDILNIKTNSIPQIIQELKPNTWYKIYVKVIDKDQQSYTTFLNVKTKEDKWVQISFNGSAFQKYNTYLIYSDGTKKKIEKSKRKIIV